jgi:ABC-type cobalamin/Fe3+-siderophores transport system ATPase subunit
LTDADGPILAVRAVTYGFPQRPDFLKPVSLEIGRGQCWGIIGPNGAGKSTLLRLFAGLLTPHSGQILLEGRPLDAIGLRDRSRRIAFLPQSPPRDVAMSARDVVLLGRYPHRQFGIFESAVDFRVANQVMATTRTLDYADRPLSTLSGGEAQRVHIAAALSQEPALLLLDEPTATLDLYHQLSIFGMLQTLTQDSRLAAIVVTHDLNLAARFCSHVVLLDEGRMVASGSPQSVITPRVLEPVYDVRLASVPAGTAREWIVPLAPSSDERRVKP